MSPICSNASPSLGAGLEEFLRIRRNVDKPDPGAARGRRQHQRTQRRIDAIAHGSGTCRVRPDFVKKGPGDRTDFHDRRQRSNFAEYGAAVIAVSGYDPGDGGERRHADFALVKKPMDAPATTTAATPSAEKPRFSPRAPPTMGPSAAPTISMAGVAATARPSDQAWPAVRRRRCG